MPSSGNALSYFVELLRTIEWGEERLGSNYVPLGSQQATIDTFPPLTSVTFVMQPPQSIYAYIFFSVLTSPSMVPGAFYFNYIAWGSTSFIGTFSSAVLAIDFTTFIPCTQTQTVRVQITNLTTAFQFFEIDFRFLVIQTQDVYRKVVATLLQRGTSSKLEADMAACRKALEKLAGGGG